MEYSAGELLRYVTNASDPGDFTSGTAEDPNTIGSMYAGSFGQQQQSVDR